MNKRETPKGERKENKMDIEKILQTEIFELAQFVTTLGIYILTDVPVGEPGFTFIHKDTKEFSFKVCELPFETVEDFMDEYFDDDEEILAYEFNLKSKNRKTIPLKIEW